MGGHGWSNGSRRWRAARTTDRLLYRQIHSTWFSGNRVTSQAFLPTSKDSKRISVDDSLIIITAESAWKHYNESGLESVGVMAVIDKECDSENLPVIPDPKPDCKAHTLIIFDELTQSARRRAASTLSRASNARGWCYRPNIEHV